MKISSKDVPNTQNLRAVALFKFDSATFRNDSNLASFLISLELIREEVFVIHFRPLGHRLKCQRKGVGVV